MWNRLSSWKLIAVFGIVVAGAVAWNATEPRWQHVVHHYKTEHFEHQSHYRFDPRTGRLEAIEMQPAK